VTKVPALRCQWALAATSILRFIEDDWALPRIGGGSPDGIAGSIDRVFDFKHSH
jgi:hypothetical protein